jgi:hypothetical protein
MSFKSVRLKKHGEDFGGRVTGCGGIISFSLVCEFL